MGHPVHAGPEAGHLLQLHRVVEGRHVTPLLARLRHSGQLQLKGQYLLQLLLGLLPIRCPQVDGCLHHVGKVGHHLLVLSPLDEVLPVQAQLRLVQLDDPLRGVLVIGRDSDGEDLVRVEAQPARLLSQLQPTEVGCSGPLVALQERPAAQCGHQLLNILHTMLINVLLVHTALVQIPRRNILNNKNS